jgi:hypothetical protein
MMAHKTAEEVLQHSKWWATLLSDMCYIVPDAILKTSRHFRFDRVLALTSQRKDRMAGWERELEEFFSCAAYVS